MLPRALLIDDPVFSEHHSTEPHHPESPERLVAAREAARLATQLLTWEALSPRDATRAELERVHTSDYLELLGQLAGSSTMLDGDTFLSPRSVAAATRAAGASVELVDALLEQRARFGLALLRPPGHHARPGAAMGFCLLNNVAVAAAAARARGLSRILVLDWDVHHGNGTQEMFWRDSEVLYVSLHQSPHYPGTGAADEIGEGEGAGFTLNVPLSQGATDAIYRTAFERVVLPIVDQFRPQLTLISAGFDAHRRDPLGGMLLSDVGYAELTRLLLSALPSDQPIGVLLEGGYDLQGLQGALLATLTALAAGPGAPSATAAPSSALTGPHEADLERALAAQRRHWRV